MACTYALNSSGSASHAHDQGRPTVKYSASVTPVSAITFNSLRHGGVRASKWPKKMPPTAKMP
jgi:hypothetical protein